MFCPKCGTQCADGSNFCIACGCSLAFCSAPKINQPAPQAVHRLAEQHVRQAVAYVPTPAPTKKSEENGFASKLKNDKLTLSLFVADIALALIVIVMAILTAVSCGDKAAEVSGFAVDRNLVGIWALSGDYEELETESTIFVFEAGGKGTRVYYDNGGSSQAEISWSTQGDRLLITLLDDEYYGVEEGCEYEIKDGYLYFIYKRSGYSEITPLCFISSDTSMSYDEVIDRFSAKKDAYFDVVEACEEETVEYLDTLSPGY